jgi:hypothetical protein
VSLIGRLPWTVALDVSSRSARPASGVVLVLAPTGRA